MEDEILIPTRVRLETNVARIGSDATIPVQIRHAYYSIIANQLPRALRERLEIKIDADAYLIRVKATIKDTETGKVWEIDLEDGDCEGTKVPCILPGEFLAMLCVVV